MQTSPRRDPRLTRIRGTYYLRFYDPPRGRCAVSLHTTERRRAESKAAPIIAAWVRGQYDPFVRKTEAEVGELVRYFMARKKRSMASRSHASLVEVVAPFLRDEGFYAPVERVETWVWARRAGKGRVSARTAHRRLAALRMVSSWLVENGLVEPPLMRITMPAVYEDAVRFLSREEARLIIEHAHTVHPSMEALVMLGLGTGGRLSSLLRLSRSDIAGGLIYFDRAKRGGYSLPVFPLAEHSLAMLPDEGPLFFMRTDHASHLFSQMRDELGWPKPYTFHVLRHTFASWLVQDGVSLYQVSKWLGHKRIATTERYAHLADCHIAAKVRGILDLRRTT